MPASAITTRTTAEERRRICDLYGLEFTMEQIAELVGRPERTVRRVLLREGVPIRPRGRRPGMVLDPKQYERVVFLYSRMGWSVRQVAAHEGLHHSTVVFRLKRAGVLRSKSEAQRLARAAGRRPDTDRAAASRKGWETRRRNAAVRNSDPDTT